LKAVSETASPSSAHPKTTALDYASTCAHTSADTTAFMPSPPDALFPGISHLRYLYHRVTGVWYPREAVVDLILAGRQAQLVAIRGYRRAFLAQTLASPPYVMTRSQQREAMREAYASARAWWRHSLWIRFANLKAFHEVFLCKYLCESGIRAGGFFPFTYPLRL
jgi:hypothetical protein